MRAVRATREHVLKENTVKGFHNPDYKVALICCVIASPIITRIIPKELLNVLSPRFNGDMFYKFRLFVEFRFNGFA